MEHLPELRHRYRKRLFAWLLNFASTCYDKFLVDRRRELLRNAWGDVLEIGPGTGANLSWYPQRVRWVGIEPNPYMHPYLRREAGRCGMSVEVRCASAEHLDFEDASIDVAIGTLVLCSVPNPARAVAEIIRVLKPGGKYLFLEHVAAESGTRLRRFQSWMTPAFGLLCDGCCPARETRKTLEEGGFSAVHCEHFRVPMPVIGPHISGFAVK